MDKFLKYESGQAFRSADEDDVKEDRALVQGRVYRHYLEKCTDERGEVVTSKSISRALGLEGINEIVRNKSTIDFSLVMESPDGGESGTHFAGFYYSLNGEPQGDEGLFRNVSFKQDGNGWSYTDDQNLNKYYTEKIKGQIYYYEGVYFP